MGAESTTTKLLQGFVSMYLNIFFTFLNTAMWIYFSRVFAKLVDIEVSFGIDSDRGLHMLLGTSIVEKIFKKYTFIAK